MKATGIVRRIDNLGRIVIPKEIRKNLRIKNGEDIEIFVNENDNIILRRYNHLDKLEDISKELGQSLYNITKKNIFITSTQKIIYSNEKKIINEELSTEIINLIYDRKELMKENQNIKPHQNMESKTKIFISPIISNGDLLGSIIIENNEINEKDKVLIKLSTSFLSKYIED